VTFDLVLVGFGNVARRFVGLLRERRAMLERDHQVSARVVGIVTRRHGGLFSSRGLDAVAIARRIERGESMRPRGRSEVAFGGSSVEFVREATKAGAIAARERRLVVVETTTLDIVRGEPAIGHVRAALSGGAHVITANKGPAAFAYRALARDAGRADRRFLFEGAVMDGIPIFNLVREALPAIAITGLRGVVNSTTNFMLTAMEQGQSFDAALAEMQLRGIAEADPSLDVDGWDAAAKAAALANVLLGARLTPRTVERQGITPATGRQAFEARAAGRRVKLVARVDRDGRRITASVGPESLPENDLLAGLEGQQNAIILRTDLLDEIAVVQRGGSLTQTAYALVADLVTIARETVLNSRSPVRRTPRATRRLRS
jgi:homoserine dehydrogenase